MEVYDSNPKSFSQSKRSQRYSDPKDKRKAHPNGQQLRKVAIEGHYAKNSQQFTFEKYVRNPSVDTPTIHSDWSRRSRYGRHNKSTVFAQTDFEKNLNTQMLTNLNYSLNRNKNWEKIDEIIENVQADEKCTVYRGRDKWGDKECDVIKLGYFDMHEMQSETEKLVKQQQKYEKALNYDVTDIDNYIKDKFYDTIARKTDKVALKRWREIQNVKPRNISKNSHFISIKSLTARSIKKGSKLRSATVKSFGRRSYWSPIKNDDARDYIQLDLGKNCLIEAVSTRGRALQREQNYEIDHANSCVEYVKKYKVMIKKDDGKPVSKRSNNNSKNKGKKDKDKEDKPVDKNMNDQFISLGVFGGNTDSESEVANKLRLPNDNKYGVVARYIRIYPLNRTEGGYYGRKSMRVGVYGNDKYKATKDSDNEDREKSNNNSDGGSNGDLIKNLDVPAAIITIKKPSQTYNRNCWAQNRMNDGVFSCGCYGCKREKFVERLVIKEKRNNFRKQIQKIKQVRDYTLDCDAIVYQTQKNKR